MVGIWTTAAAIAYHMSSRAPPVTWQTSLVAMAQHSLGTPSGHSLSPRQARLHITMMNRLLLDESECTITEPSGELVACLQPSDRRSEHVRNVLRAQDGARLRAGVLDAGSTDEATVRWVACEDAATDERALHLNLGSASRMLVPLEQAARPRLDLLLAMPRPPQFARLLPMIASLGVDRLWVTGGARVEKSYFSSHLLREENAAALRAACGACVKCRGRAQQGHAMRRPCAQNKFTLCAS